MKFFRNQKKNFNLGIKKYFNPNLKYVTVAWLFKLAISVWVNFNFNCFCV